MTTPLFRQEVLDAKRSGWLGGISLAQPVPVWMLTAFASGAALGIVLFLVLGSYTRRAQVSGHLVPTQGMAVVLAPATGVISQLQVEEGALVEAGQKLAVVNLPRVTVNQGDTAAAVEARLQRRQQGLQTAHVAQQHFLDAQTSGLAEQLASARKELDQLEKEIGTRQGQARIASETLQRLRQLQADKHVSDLQVKQQQAQHLQAIADVQALQRQASASRRHIAQLEQALQELPSQRLAHQASYERDLALLEQEQVETEARGALVINAPVSGMIATQLVKPGQAVQAGQSLMAVLPGDGSLEAELLVPSHAIGFVEPGDKVLLRYQAFPYQKFGHHYGKVSRISRSALNQSELQTLLGSAVQAGSLYRVTVTLEAQHVTAYGKPEPLKPGMVLEADILGEKRRLIEWVFEPLYSLKGRMQG